MYEEIEISSYREVMKFCVGKGFTLEEFDFDIFLNGIDDDDVDQEDFNCWTYFHQLLELIEQNDAKNELPSYVKHLHNFWQKSLWPDIYGDN